MPSVGEHTGKRALKPFGKAGLFLAIFNRNYLVCSLLSSRTLKSIRAHHKLFPCSISFPNLKQLKGWRQRPSPALYSERCAPVCQDFGFPPTNSPLCPCAELLTQRIICDLSNAKARAIRPLSLGVYAHYPHMSGRNSLLCTWLDELRVRCGHLPLKEQNNGMRWDTSSTSRWQIP